MHSFYRKSRRVMAFVMVAVVLAAAVIWAGYNLIRKDAGTPLGIGEQGEDNGALKLQEQESVGKNENGQVENPDIRANTADEKTVTLQLFFVSEKAVETGQLGEYGLVTPVKRTLVYTPSVLTLALTELIRGPLPGDGKVGSTIPTETRILQVKIEDGTAIVNLSREVLTHSSGGTFGGMVLIQSMVCTAVQFPTVKNLKVLVEGEPWNDGHYIWDRPLEIKDVIPAP